MEKVRAKKHLGQHFLTNEEIAVRIAGLASPKAADAILEIGPGMGVLTKHLLTNWGNRLTVVEIDTESVGYLKNQPWAAGLNIAIGDALNLNWQKITGSAQLAVIGNYPYNISTEIAFRVIDQHATVSWFGGMFQKEVAQRFCAPHGNREYGITSVLLQAYYDCTFEFSVPPENFSPPPAVQSGVMSCVRKPTPECTLKSLKTVVKAAFSQRRKMLNNAMKSLVTSKDNFTLPEAWKELRAEQLSVEDFVELALLWEKAGT